MNMNKIIFAYYLLYKFIQINIYVEILKSKDRGILTGLWSRTIAFIFNFIHSFAVEPRFKSMASQTSLLSLYTSLLIILPYITMAIGVLDITFFADITFFVLNLTLCESIVFGDFLQFWQIQLCLELSIMANYICTACNISLHTGVTFIPTYVLWIFSILLPHSKFQKYSVDINVIPSPKSVVNYNLKMTIYTLLQGFLSLCYILIGCTTVRNNIFEIFDNIHFSVFEVTLIMVVLCLLVLSACILVDLKRKFKIILILILVFSNYLIMLLKGYLIKCNILTNSKYIFIVDIMMKKILCMCKCCISSFLLKNQNKTAYKGTHFRMVKFYILNVDTLSFVFNLYIAQVIDVDLLNIYISIIIVVLYCWFKFL